jgi:nucleotide-binding universal stress UspA family protein
MAAPDTLLVMATHGRTGVRRAVLGSVAEKVLRSAADPVLLAGPHLEPDRPIFGGRLNGRDPAARLMDMAARLPAAAIALTTHGRTGLPRLVLGSVAMEVVHRAPCPVLVGRSSAGG